MLKMCGMFSCRVLFTYGPNLNINFLSDMEEKEQGKIPLETWMKMEYAMAKSELLCCSL
jgi:hypothetical protein